MKFLIFVSIILIFSPKFCQSTAQEMTKIVEKREKICSLSNCKLPLCKCSNTLRPSQIELDDTPMMVAISFNGIVASEYGKYIKKILNPIFKNPNGCPIQGTFFVSNTGNGTSDYCLVESLFNNNNEIAVGAPKYSCPYTDCESLGRYFMKWKEDSADTNIFEQKKTISTKAKINRSFLRGFRLPFLDQGGNQHFTSLKKYAFNYDSSVIIKPEDIKRHHNFRIWPHTMDFEQNYTCPTCPDRKKLCNRGESNCICDESNCTTNGVWIVPMFYFDAEGRHPCPTLIKDEIPDNRLQTKDCLNRKDLTQEKLEKLLMDIFSRHYDTNKAPLVINIETVWFETHGDMLTGALSNFVNKLTSPKSKLASKNDIYVVSISKIVEWIEYPTALNVIANKWLWDCDGNSYDYDEECEIIKKLRESSEELEEMRKKNKTKLMELKGEDLFRNGIFTAVIIIFILSILFTVFYDKYH